jgi:FHS family L-fucose permease-like MFS transporter
MSTEKPPVVPGQYLLAFILLTTCFAAWGAANNMTDPLVKVFTRIWSMSNLQGALVQFSFYGAYFCLALPAALIIKRFSYKTGVLTGLGLFIFGALLFYPASQTMTYVHFLLAIYILASGLSILETSCNPYIIALGDERTATQRLNLAQSFNPIGSNIGVFLAATFILPKVNPATDAEREALAATDPAALEAIQRAELSAVMGPYVTMACVLLVFWLAIAFTRMPAASDPSKRIDFLPTLRRLFHNRHYAFGVVAQFFYVAAQICVWTFLIQYATLVLDFTEETAGWYLQASIIIFLVFRFICTALMRMVRPSAMLVVMSALAAALALYAVMVPGLSGLWAIVAISACMSLMFPTIYGIALQGLGPDTKIGAAGLVMAILGGALFPLAQARIIDTVSANASYIVPFLCFIVVAAYAVFDLRKLRIAHGTTG